LLNENPRYADLIPGDVVDRPEDLGRQQQQPPPAAAQQQREREAKDDEDQQQQQRIANINLRTHSGRKRSW